LKPKAEAKLFDAMTELLQRDFNNGEKYLDEYRKMCIVAPTAPEQAEEARKETQRRTANFLCLLAQGREGQGKLGEALEHYLEFGSLPTAQGELLSVVTEPAVRAKADVWARGRIKAMMEHATDDQRKPLEEVILGKWTEVKSSGDVEKLRHFVNMFGETAAIGKEGRLYLAERLAEREGRADLLDAELQFLTLTNDEDPSFVVRALDGLARLCTRKGLLEDAYAYYRQLKIRFGNVPVRDGKTGAQLFDELATDKRFLQYMDEPGEVQGKAKFKWDLERDKNNAQQAQHMLYTFDPLGNVLPFLKHHRVAVNYSSSHLMLVDRRTNETALDEQLKENFQQFMTGQVANPNMPPGLMVPGMPQQAQPNRFGYHAVGHLVVVNLGQYIAAIDTVTHKVPWQKNLFGAQSPVSGNSYLHYNPNDETLQLQFQNGTYMTIGQGGPVASTYVCVQTRDGLSALDPLTGNILWTRADVPTRCRLFGDEQHIYLVETDNNGSAVNTRAFRAQDGASESVPDFAALFQKRVRIIGRELLVADRHPGNDLDLRLYDVQTGKDLWKEHYPKGTIVLDSDDAELAGVVTPDGHATIVNLRLRKRVAGGVLTPDDLKNLQQAHLLADDQYYYIALNTSNPNNPPQIWTNLQANTGLRGITINGELYAFNRRTSKVEWHNSVKHLQMVMEQWREMPVLLFTSRYFENSNNGGMRFFPGQQMGTIGIQVYDKRTGKLLVSEPTQNRPQLNQQSGQVYAVHYDVRAGKVEMIAQNYKVTLTQEGESSSAAAAEKGNKPAVQSTGAGGQAGGGGPPALPRATPQVGEIKK
jgi:outer membrane protein assembly factor BamB